MREIIKQVFKLNNTQSNIMLELWKSYEPIDVKELATKLGKDRTTIQKIINLLYRKGLINKRQLNLNAGFKFTYKINNKPKLLIIIKEFIVQEQQKLNLMLKEFEK